MYNHKYANDNYNRKYPQQNICNRCCCGINNCCDVDILTFILLRHLIKNINCGCCMVSPYA